MEIAKNKIVPHPLVRIKPGDIVWTWCGKCMDRTDHIYCPGEASEYQCTRCRERRDRGETPKIF